MFPREEMKEKKTTETEHHTNVPEIFPFIMTFFVCCGIGV
jgi:hypothetical protein